MQLEPEDEETGRLVGDEVVDIGDDRLNPPLAAGGDVQPKEGSGAAQGESERPANRALWRPQEHPYQGGGSGDGGKLFGVAGADEQD